MSAAAALRLDEPSFEPCPVENVPGPVESGILILCDHASNAVPPDLGDLGLPEAEFERHIAYDIGAAAVTRSLARRLGAPAILTRFSRLVIDPNRGRDDPTPERLPFALLGGIDAIGDRVAVKRRMLADV